MEELTTETQRHRETTTKTLEQRSRNQMEICRSVPPTRFPGDVMPSLSLCPPYVIASAAKQSPFVIMPPLCHCERSEAIPLCHYAPLVSLRAGRSNPPYPTIRDCFAALAMTQAPLAMTQAPLAMTQAPLAMRQAPLAMRQGVFSARRLWLRRTLPLKNLRSRRCKFLAERTRKRGIVVRRHKDPGNKRVSFHLSI